MATGRIPINGTAAIQSTIVDAKGDLIAATADNTVARLGVGANGTTLVADSSEATGLKWASAAAGGMTVLASGSLSGASVTISSIPQDYIDLVLCVKNRTHSNAGNARIRLNGDSTSTYRTSSTYGNDNTFTLSTALFPTGDVTTTEDGNFEQERFYNYANSTTRKLCQFNSWTSVNTNIVNRLGVYAQTTAITSIEMLPEGALHTLTGGTYVLYGVK